MTTVKILALNGGPHRAGNTVTLMRWVVDGCLAAGASVEWMHVIDHDIGVTARAVCAACGQERAP
jgi:multimeric flavodoxin WrbA